jgi:hypothetical protein
VWRGPAGLGKETINGDSIMYMYWDEDLLRRVLESDRYFIENYPKTVKFQEDTEDIYEDEEEFWEPPFPLTESWTVQDDTQ